MLDTIANIITKKYQRIQDAYAKGGYDEAYMEAKRDFEETTKAYADLGITIHYHRGQFIVY